MRRKARVLGLAAIALVGACALGSSSGLRWLAQPDVPAPAGVAPEPAVDPQTLRADVVKLTVGFPQRSHAHPEVLDDAARWIEGELREAGGRTKQQRFVVNGRSYANVIASFGADAGSRVVVGAHYDSALGLPGADDDASGVAGLLEVARALGRRPPTGRVDLVAYTLEEPPYFATEHMGSAHHARALRDEGAAVTAMLSLEMIGCFSDAPGSQRFPSSAMKGTYGDVGDFVTVIGDLGSRALIARVKGAMRAASDLRVESLSAPRFVTGVDWSDHRSYWDLGYPAVMITDTSFLRNERYHTALDVADTLDYARMAKVVQGVIGAVRHLAGGS